MRASSSYVINSVVSFFSLLPSLRISFLYSRYYYGTGTVFPPVLGGAVRGCRPEARAAADLHRQARQGEF